MRPPPFSKEAFDEQPPLKKEAFGEQPPLQKRAFDEQPPYELGGGQLRFRNWSEDLTFAGRSL